MLNWLLFAVFVVATKGCVQNTCTAPYLAIDSTLCDPPASGTNSDIPTQAEQNEIVNKHNALRAIVNVNGVVPAHMPSLEWDEKLAAVAQAWACTFPHPSQPHDDNSARAIPEYPGLSVGQNVAFSSADLAWSAPIQLWYDEVNWFGWGVGSLNGSTTKHFSQFVLDKSTRIGCGKSVSGDGYHYVCNYAVQQSYSSSHDDSKTPYADSTVRNSGCTDSDNNGLCDFTSPLCFNKATIDYSDGSCDCVEWDLVTYTGPTCLDMSCPTTEHGECGEGLYFPPSSCSPTSNVPYDYCPFMCGVCEHNCGSNTCSNGGTMDYSTCTCTCPSGFSGTYCDDAVCGGMTCQNGGTLNQSTCSCNCYAKTSGDYCETIDCNDHFACGSGIPAGHCTQYANVPYDYCPTMCGIC